MLHGCVWTRTADGAAWARNEEPPAPAPLPLADPPAPPPPHADPPAPAAPAPPAAPPAEPAQEAPAGMLAMLVPLAQAVLANPPAELPAALRRRLLIASMHNWKSSMRSSGTVALWVRVGARARGVRLGSLCACGLPRRGTACWRTRVHAAVHLRCRQRSNQGRARLHASGQVP